MPVFSLRVIDEQHPNWAMSTYRGPCLVHAADESDARTYAFGAFGIAVERKSPQDETLYNPFRSPDVVSCTEIAAVGPTAYEEGLVLVPTSGAEEWRAVRR